eukprot:6888095-Lingulodinium_polyedra.AAC.1
MAALASRRKATLALYVKTETFRGTQFCMLKAFVLLAATRIYHSVGLDVFGLGCCHCVGR